MLALTQETQLLWCSQISGTGVVTGWTVVTGVGAVVLGGTEVTFGVTVVFCAAVSTQSAARQAAAQSSWRESPDITTSALVFRRKLQLTTLSLSLRPLRRRLRDSAPPAGAR